MAGDRFLRHDGSGGYSEIEGVQTSTNNAIPALDATGKINLNMMPSGVGADIVTLATSEDLAAGDLVNIYDVTGTPTARKANATDATKPVVGFVLASSTSPANAVVYLEGPLSGLSGLTAGTRMYLSAATSGANTATPPTGTGKVVSFIGRAVNATTINFEPSDPILLA